MKNNFIKSLMNSLNSREREREREREVSQGGLSMKKEKINNNKNNKIISFILAIVMCCRSFVGAVPLNTDGKVNVAEPVSDDMGIDDILDDILFEYVPISEYKGEKCEKLAFDFSFNQAIFDFAISAIFAISSFFLKTINDKIDESGIYQDIRGDKVDLGYSVIGLLPSSSRPIADFYPFYGSDKKSVADLKPIKINLPKGFIANRVLSDVLTLRKRRNGGSDDYTDMLAHAIYSSQEEYNNLYEWAVEDLNKSNKQSPRGFHVTNAYITLECEDEDSTEGSKKDYINLFLSSKFFLMLKECSRSMSEEHGFINIELKEDRRETSR
ncbi:MAG: hypothetical protein CfP315_0418 [Candidatus Improbicoccus pseudotrichonymphae]|uniref:Uncharacterized protein n=1 Tax=Candidatus Improbicoccus pseudotrichonymphae TaxID=3033792 RepID=A0AA48HUZ4_9FIRM|nr:MAG: hypothetical protein CfP315_0418 [Candidatus Improbicoccus pseudotrichonymphae]